MRPRFTVLLTVIPERLSALTHCLATLEGLTDRERVQILVVCDGGATPPSVPPAWNFQWINVPSGGPAKARNRALAAAEGELILFLNDDVRCEPGLLAAHDRAHRENPGRAVMGNTRWAPEVISSEFMHWVAHHDSYYYLMPTPSDCTWHYFHTMNLSLDRSWIDRGFRFDETFPDPAFEDTDLGLRLWKAGMRMSFAPDAILYHVHGYTAESYLAKSRMRGRSAARFLEIHPEEREQILSEYQWQAKRLDGWRGACRRLMGRMQPLEVLEARIAREFLRGYEGRAAISRAAAAPRR